MTNRLYLYSRRIFLSVAIGTAAGYALVFHYFNESPYSAIDRFFLLIVPAASAVICVYHLFSFIEKKLLSLSYTTKFAFFFFALISTLLICTSISSLPILFRTSVFISLLTVFFSGSLPAATAFQTIIDTKRLPNLLAGCVFSAILFFIGTGFLDNFYENVIEIIFISLLGQILLGAITYLFAHRLKDFVEKNKTDSLLLLALFIVILVFIERFFQYGTEAPQLLIREYFAPNINLLPIIGGISIFFLPWGAWILSKADAHGALKKIKSTRLYAFIDKNLTGIVLALAFFLVYFVIATVLNHPSFDVDDVFFDADGMNWRLRLTTDNWHDYYWRSVHPFVLLLLKPPVDLAAMLLRGNKLFGGYMVVALGGASCVFLAWKFIKGVTGDNVYAALIASILGFSASHLVFGSLIETYIFLAAGLLLFFVFLLEEKPLSTLVLASLPVIGITHSNFMQNILALSVTKPNFKLILRYVTVVLILLIQLSLVNNLFFPDAQPLFFIPSALLAEEQNIFPLNTLRFEALTRALLFNNIVAPTPILHTGDIPFTQFRFFKPEINELSVYNTALQTFTVWFWLGLMLMGLIVFLSKFKEYKSNRLSLALAGCMILNLGLHLRYGKELFLYSSNWTYALILLLGLALQRFAKHRWLQIILLIFVSFLMFNNSWLFDTFFYVLSSD